MNAHGKWIIFVDSDDWLEVDCIEKCLKLINEYHLDFLQFGLKRVDDNGRVLSADGKETAVLSAEEYIRTGKIGICVGGGIFKADIIQAANLRFDTDLKLEKTNFLFIVIFPNANIVIESIICSIIIGLMLNQLVLYQIRKSV